MTILQARHPTPELGHVPIQKAFRVVENVLRLLDYFFCWLHTTYSNQTIRTLLYPSPKKAELTVGTSLVRDCMRRRVVCAARLLR